MLFKSHNALGALVFLKSLSDAVKKRDFLFLAESGGRGEDFAVLTVLVIKNCQLKVYELLKIRVNAFVTLLRDNIGFRPPCWYHSDGPPTWCLLTKIYKFG